ncbi:MAG: glycosyltransferase family 4 protein [Armatimonadetes bacterium]|nr:glycosyltransferase family 4 protein [Armatimonadota bacterium]
MRIAYADHAVDIGGAEKSLTDLIARLDCSRYEPTLLCAADAKWLEGARLEGVTIERVFGAGGVLDRKRDDLAPGLLSNARTVRQAMPLVFRLWRTIRRLGPDIVHTNTLKTHLLAGAAARFAGRRLIWHLRDILEEGNARKLLLRAARRLRPKVIAISEAVRRSLGGAEVDVVVVYNGTDLSAFRPSPRREALRAALGLQPEEVAISIVGRLTPWKGHRELLRAFAEVVREEPRTRLLVVGEVAFWEDTYETELRNLAEELGIASLVQWLGFRSDVPDILAATDIFALPSIDEPFGRAVVEAMAVQLPVIGTRSGGVPEIVVEGKTGLLVPPGDQRELAAALVRLARDAELRRSMGQAGRARATDLFDVNRTAQRVQEVYAGEG